MTTKRTPTRMRSGVYRKVSPPLRRSILIAIDDLALRHAVALVLHSHGHNVVSVSDASRWIARMVMLTADHEDGSIALVVCSERLPDGAALDVLAELRGLTVGTPALVLVEKEDAHAAARALTLGATILKMPFDTHTLCAVADALAASPGSEGNGRP